MGAHMKTTIDIADPILLEAKRVASREGVTVRSMVEAGLRAQLTQRAQRPVPFKLRQASFKGRGLHDQAKGKPWHELRELAYAGRGG